MSGLSLVIRMPNLKSVAFFTVLNWSDWPFRCENTEDTHINENSISAIHFVRSDLYNAIVVAVASEALAADRLQLAIGNGSGRSDKLYSRNRSALVSRL